MEINFHPRRTGQFIHTILECSREEHLLLLDENYIKTMFDICEHEGIKHPDYCSFQTFIDNRHNFDERIKTVVWNPQDLIKLLSALTITKMVITHDNKSNS